MMTASPKSNLRKTRSPNRNHLLPAVLDEAGNPIMDEYELYYQSSRRGSQDLRIAAACSSVEKVDMWIGNSSPSSAKRASHGLLNISPTEPGENECVTCAINKHRSHSFKERRPSSNFLTVELQRPRAHSLTTQCLYHQQKESDHVRSFVRTKEGLINKGDAVRTRSSCSLTASSRSTETDAQAGTKLSGDAQSEACEMPEISGALDKTVVSVNIPVPIPSKQQEMKQYVVQVIGAPRVGKTTLCQQFLASGVHLLSTDGTPDHTSESLPVAVTVVLDGEEHGVTLIDSQTTDELESIQIFEADAYMVVFAVNNRESFKYAKCILNELFIEAKKSSATLLVGNKSDLVRKRVVSHKEGKNLAKVYDVNFMEISTTFAHNVDELLVSILTEISKKRQRVRRQKQKLLGRGRPSRASMLAESSRQFFGNLLKKKASSRSYQDLDNSV